MKLPARDDPGGDREGALPRERVLHILEENDVETSRHRDDKYVLSLDDTIRVVILPDRVGGIMIRFLSRTFRIQLVKFYFDDTERDPGPPH